MDGGFRSAIERVWARVVADPRHELEKQLDPSDLNTLLMALSRVRASAVSPARLVQRWTQDPFVRPSSSDPRHVWRIENQLWDLLPRHFDGIDLSPVTPLATCSAVAPVDQNLIVSTARGTEVVSDPTNVLALEAALRRKRDPARSVDIAACHRVVRARPVHGEGLCQHFRLFALVSAGETGVWLNGGRNADQPPPLLDAGVTEIAPDAGVVIQFSPFDSQVAQERFTDTVVPALQPLPPRAGLQLAARQRARGYYAPGPYVSRPAVWRSVRSFHGLDGQAHGGQEGTLPDLLHRHRAAGGLPLPDRSRRSILRVGTKIADPARSTTSPRMTTTEPAGTYGIHDPAIAFETAAIATICARAPRTTPTSTTVAKRNAVMASSCLTVAPTRRRSRSSSRPCRVTRTRVLTRA